LLKSGLIPLFGWGDGRGGHLQCSAGEMRGTRTVCGGSKEGWSSSGCVWVGKRGTPGGSSQAEDRR